VGGGPGLRDGGWIKHVAEEKVYWKGKKKSLDFLCIVQYLGS
jgi:hypothetical protein